jgi:hypothetical protein
MQPHEPGDQLKPAASKHDLASCHSSRVSRLFVRPAITHEEFGRDQAQGSEFHVCLGPPKDS